ncbi:MAG: hypothetical protein KDC87_19755, partial [Planctomycetes bacterium]|nr:hypothetical protein [Planctomycetota bacterium]
MDSAAHRLLDVQRIVAATDAWVFRPVAGRGRGYADNTPGWCRTAAFELTRGGWAQLVQVLLEQPARGTALQIGLGRFGGSHFALGQLFDRVLTVEIDAERVEAFRAANPERSGRDQFVVGDATLRQTFEEVRRHAASVDFLLLDGGDTYGQMAASWRRFAGLVAPGGMVAVVDSSQRFQEVRDRIGVDRFIADLTAVLRSCGIALACTRANPQVHYYRVTEQAHTALAATLRHEPSDGGRDAPELLQPDHLGWATYAHRGFVAVRADSPAFEPRQVFRGERAELLWAP